MPQVKSALPGKQTLLRNFCTRLTGEMFLLHIPTFGIAVEKLRHLYGTIKGHFINRTAFNSISD